MTRICPHCLDTDTWDRSAQAAVLLREEPEEDEDEDEGDRKEDDEDEDTDDGYSDVPLFVSVKREEFINFAEETLNSLPEEFRSRIQNVAILVEDYPPKQSRSQPGQQSQLLLGIFHGVPATKKSVFDLSAGPAHIVLYQKNIEAVCSNEAEVRHQIRQTLIHELGHYFGMTEEQLKDV